MVLRIALVAAVMFLCLAVQALVLAVSLRCVVRVMRTEGPPARVLAEVGTIYLIMMVMLTGHVVQIGLWAVLYVLEGAFVDFQTALYFSGATFTTIGYGDVALQPGWYMLGPLEGITGLLMFGVSTAGMAAVIMRMLKVRLAHMFAGRDTQ